MNSFSLQEVERSINGNRALLLPMQTSTPAAAAAGAASPDARAATVAQTCLLPAIVGHKRERDSDRVSSFTVSSQSASITPPYVRAMEAAASPTAYLLPPPSASMVSHETLTHPQRIRRRVKDYVCDSNCPDSVRQVVRRLNQSFNETQLVHHHALHSCATFASYKSFEDLFKKYTISFLPSQPITTATHSFCSVKQLPFLTSQASAFSLEAFIGYLRFLKINGVLLSNTENSTIKIAIPREEYKAFLAFSFNILCDTTGFWMNRFIGVRNNPFATYASELREAMFILQANLEEKCDYLVACIDQMPLNTKLPFQVISIGRADAGDCRLHRIYENIQSLTTRNLNVMQTEEPRLTEANNEQLPATEDSRLAKEEEEEEMPPASDKTADSRAPDPRDRL